MNIKTANRLCELRKSRGLSQEELAEKLGVSRQAVSKWERGESSPDTDNLIELARIYGISIDELINGSDIPKSDGGDDGGVHAEVHIDDEENTRAEVHIDNDGIHISKGNKKAEIDNDGIHISKGSKKVKIDDDGIRVNDEGGERKEGSIVGHIVYSTYSIIVAIAYLLLGFLLPDGYGWSHFWFLFITIPVVGSLKGCLRRRMIKSFNYPCFVTALYCALGMFLSLWHPTWVLFITIPVFYIVADILQRKK